MKLKIVASLLALTACAAHAADWSDSYISYSRGWKYREPANPYDLRKDVISLTYIGGNKLGSNFFNVDMLRSDTNNPARNTNNGAQEVYVVFSNTLSISKLASTDLSFGPVRDVTFHSGFDFSSKNDLFGGAEFKLIGGPKVELAVPGYLSFALLAVKDWGNNSIAGKQVNSDLTWRLATVWQFDVPLGLPAIFKGWGTYTGKRGLDGFGNPMHRETWMETSLMWDVGSIGSWKPKTFYAGIGYQFIKNKFNNAPSLTGTRVSSPSIRFEAHF